MLKPCKYAFYFILLANELRVQDKNSSKYLNVAVTESGVYESLTRKAIGFKSLGLNCYDITQVNIKMGNVNYC